MIIYSSYIESQTPKRYSNYWRKKSVGDEVIKKEKKKIYDASVPLIVEKFMSSTEKKKDLPTLETESNAASITPTHFPYSVTQNVKIHPHGTEPLTQREVEDWESFRLKDTTKEEIELRMEAFHLGILEGPEKHTSNEDCEVNRRKLREEEFFIEDEAKWHPEIATADPSVPVSQIPCGGCGAHLHCQESALPGFVSKEEFVGLSTVELRGLLCQRCYFLRHYNTALNVRVTPELYPKLLEPIREQKALAIVVVDLIDMPCSIWPKLIDILGTKRPVVVVGNKVDLLPADGKNHLERVSKALVAAVEKTDLGRANIRHYTLVSAQTGFGIESLITKIQNIWSVKGDIYLLGCTNSGKSTLFNALVASDLCKTHASTRIAPATVSPWPGTTLNMIKFPLLRPSGYRLYLRTQRLIQERMKPELDKPTYTRSPSVATLSSIVGKTFIKSKEPEEIGDPFSMKMTTTSGMHPEIVGINPMGKDYKLSKWCYDTPGTVQPDQIINLLSHEELLKLLPRHIILPQTLTLKTGESLFVGGLARLDLLYSPQSVRFTVFRSAEVPLTAVKTVDAAAFYCKYLGTEILGIPIGSEERLKSWPALKPKDFRMYSTGKQSSCADVVLSSAGWVALTGLSEGDVVEVRGWTPGGRGAYLRQPAILPRAVTFRGHRKTRSVAHGPHKFYVSNVPR
ncbi:hypothetical protein Pmani_012008 [Petrolisthes manimaculis]|uniref:G domain-containing protein n=1 Tax=Petrolisthes manimaculis TaxID=1843537 RepID=A0AAE1UAW9_9EUCA|nr:hypothetical protein Pmani_012008 [Petrolisthes manimaculis]